MVKKITNYIELYNLANKYFLSPPGAVKSMNPSTRKQPINPWRQALQELDKNTSDIFKSFTMFIILYGFPKNQFNATQWVMHTSSLMGNDRLVAIVIANFYNAQKGFAYPSVSQVAAITGLSERKVRYSIKAMKLSGEWLIVNPKRQPYDEGEGIANKYFILPPLGLGLFNQLKVDNLIDQEGTNSLTENSIFRKEQHIENKDLSKEIYLEGKKFSEALNSVLKEAKLNNSTLRYPDLKQNTLNLPATAGKIFRLPTPFTNNIDIVKYNTLCKTLREAHKIVHEGKYVFQRR